MSVNVRRRRVATTRKWHAPLVVAVVAHEVHGGEVEPALARRALRDVEHARTVRIGKLFDLAELRLSLRAVRRNELLVLFRPYQ